MDVGRIEGHQHGIEVEPAHRFEQDGRIVVAGQAQEPDAPLLAGLDEGLEGPAAAEDRAQVAGCAQVVELPEVQVVGVQPVQALLQQPERAVAGAIVRLGREEHIAATLAQRGAIVVEAPRIGWRRVAVVHTLVQRPVDHGHRLGHPAMSPEHALAPEGELGHLVARAAQRPARDRGDRAPRSPSGAVDVAAVVVAIVVGMSHRPQGEAVDPSRSRIRDSGVFSGTGNRLTLVIPVALADEKAPSRPREAFGSNGKKKRLPGTVGPSQGGVFELNRFPIRDSGFPLAAQEVPTVSKLLAAAAELASSASISRSSLLSVLLRQTAQATPARQTTPIR